MPSSSVESIKIKTIIGPKMEQNGRRSGGGGHRGLGRGRGKEQIFCFCKTSSLHLGHMRKICEVFLIKKFLSQKFVYFRQIRPVRPVVDVCRKDASPTWKDDALFMLNIS